MEIFVALVSEGLIPAEPELFVSEVRRDEWVRDVLEEQSHATLEAMVYNAIENHTIEEFPFDGDPDREPKGVLVPALMRAAKLGTVYDEDIEVRTWTTELDTRD